MQFRCNFNSKNSPERRKPKEASECAKRITSKKECSATFLREASTTVGAGFFGRQNVGKRASTLGTDRYHYY
jgi:hypothetical protein